jgi:hypothetical protein
LLVVVQAEYQQVLVEVVLVDIEHHSQVIKK